MSDVQSCHLTTYTRHKKLIHVHELPEDEKLLLHLRTEVHFEHDDNMTICIHHHKILLDKFEFLQKTCCDPNEQHPKPRKLSLRALTVESAKTLSDKFNRSFKPGQKLCPDCRKKLLQLPSDMSPVRGQDKDIPAQEEVCESVNKSLTALGCTPLKSVAESKHVSYAKRKLIQSHSAFQDKIGQVLHLNSSEILDILPTSSATDCHKCDDLDEILTQMKQKCRISSSYAQKVQILTMVPCSWSIQKTAREFSVSEYMARKAKELKSIHGILAEPVVKKGKMLSADVKLRVTEFYENDEMSRLCPGKKDYVSVKIDGSKVQKQKRLLLANIEELYSSFKEQNPDCKVGISKFYELRPQWCITVGVKGTHSVCVCEIHQNLKLLLAAVKPLKLDYKQLMAHQVCDISARECMLHGCPNCPGKGAVKTYLRNRIRDEMNIEDESDEISFKQWQHTDRTTLITRTEKVSDFLELLVQQNSSVTTHHFIAKSQASFLSASKENLDENTAIVLLDFAENYSFIVQDAVQGFHWENSQATLHPFAIYYKVNGQFEKACLCVVMSCSMIQLQSTSSQVLCFHI